MVKKAILKIIKFYQMFISPGMGYHCRFYPSCSEYTAETIKKHGTLEGIKRGLWRIIRCHPFNKGGIDLP
ncbi:MAG: membrane protein insertion efficiency factor YidD [Candidatus Nealsonbacteria bacterium CG02_land_8_20_14_3_00_37_10]|uniref:Putative membrane protein insertion efficiency factor n=1 Tax=Candidatus Nealsonbacteria bacterium CG02_land_8_20_14_3_00_37_10 TaxID=1974699 RepID=A0A2M7DA75_9BACT|nr:MAG: membrane protein insertion efficiency factor YidD [Candidatus Nealsonbacteria bacterium CG02_land_8_20_14_3_00_37_10]